MRLCEEDRALLAGDLGPAARRAMEIIVALGTVYDAEDLVPVESAQVAGVSYKNLGEAGLDFLETWAGQGARVRVPCTLNPAGMDLANWRALGIPEEFALRQQRVIAAYVRMGVQPTCTCAPYLVGQLPTRGAHLAWSESSAVSYANSIAGACTNREGGPSALAAAICGRTPRYGLHLTESRRATHRVQVGCTIQSEADLGVLGYLAGRLVGDGVPLFDRGALESHGGCAAFPPDLRPLAAAMAASGAVALFHVAGVTPEAEEQPPGPAPRTVRIDSLKEGYAALESPVDRIDFVSVGCPHASVAEIAEVARALEGKRAQATVWVTTAAAIRQQADKAGYLKVIEEAGGRVVADTCLVVAPVEAMGWRTMATNSAKAAFYAHSHSRLQVRLGSLEQCLEAAMTGRWRGDGRR